jgi:hypothetical protein
MKSAGDNPYEAPQTASERPAESDRSEQRISWRVGSFLFGVFWIVLVAAIGVPSHASDRVTPKEYWFVLCAIASFPAAAFFWLAWRAWR